MENMQKQNDMGQCMKFWYLSHMHKYPLANARADVYSEARGLNFSLSLHLHPYFVYASREGSAEEPSLLADKVNTETLCTGPNGI